MLRHRDSRNNYYTDEKRKKKHSKWNKNTNSNSGQKLYNNNYNIQNSCFNTPSQLFKCKIYAQIIKGNFKRKKAYKIDEVLITLFLHSYNHMKKGHSMFLLPFFYTKISR